SSNAMKFMDRGGGPSRKGREGRRLIRKGGLHDYTIRKSVLFVCPRCFAEIEGFDPEYPTDICDGHLVDRAGRVYLRRFCRRGHGEVWSLYEESAELWRYLQQWRVPTRVINPDTKEVFP